ncbi:metal ABC transporter permease [Paracoccus chinensis]|uniref:High-affinity zinc uptake system membrane protein ZnuB n=1 Tax=Paracoccus chinensis TaxID=525640 RepID=A0A1G9KP44_9RHOB|nr:metal ABC transporter permease [Paracoccus chinensis]SDL51439.1 zinc transport system permease protein [Paracoccus chinensis]
MLDDFMLRAALGAIGLALACAPLGCFVVWRRMAYYGDATAHAALLGVALSLALALPLFPAVIVVALAMAAVVAGLAGRQSVDTMLGVLSHGALAAGMVAVSFVQGVRTDLSAYLFGDILSVSALDLGLIWGGAGLVAALIAWRWSALLLSTLSPEMAVADGIRPRTEQWVLNIALALVVAAGIRIVGALLVSAMLIIPAAAARPLARSPEAMVAATALIGSAAGVLGLGAAFRLDTPTGPTIVCAAVAIFAAVTTLGLTVRRRPA